MKGLKGIDAQLSRVLHDELTAINQYFLHARMLKNWGFLVLARYEYKESIEVMKQADQVIERILFLEGMPKLEGLAKPRIGRDPPEIIRNDLALGIPMRDDLLAAIVKCEELGDFVSRDLLAGHLEETEERIDFCETQLDLLAKMGLENYLQSAIGAIDG